MTREDVCARIHSIGIIPAIRVSSLRDAEFAAAAVREGGIPIVEITMTVPGAIELISELVRGDGGIVVGAGSILDTETAERCLDAGARFLTSTGLDLSLVELAKARGVVVLPGALTPTEVIAAWKAGSDFVKVFPCTQVGGDHYIRALKAPLPQVPIVAAGGVNQHNAASFILAGAAAIGIGTELVPKEAIRLGNKSWIIELAQRFVRIVNTARAHGNAAGTDD